jgi:hypothetical protein
MKAWKIDADQKRIYLVDISDDKTLEQWYELIGNNCDMVETVCVDNNGDSLLCDEEGLFNPATRKGFIYEYPGDQARFTICGNGLLVGLNAETGDSEDVKAVEAEVLPRIVRWLDESFVQGYKARFQ